MLYPQDNQKSPNLWAGLVHWAVLILLTVLFSMAGVYIFSNYDSGLDWFLFSFTSLSFVCIIIEMPSLTRDFFYRLYCPHGVRGGDGLYRKRCKLCAEQQKVRLLAYLQEKIERIRSEVQSKQRNKEKTPQSPSKSPIEVAFWNQLQTEVRSGDIGLFSPQHCVGPYRIDFAIPSKHIAIELDGHESHKTKLQRTHDAQRERYLQKEGWQVIRFTGTEIYNDVHKCVKEVVDMAKLARVSVL